jgi:hypothetical protein
MSLNPDRVASSIYSTQRGKFSYHYVTTSWQIAVFHCPKMRGWKMSSECANLSYGFLSRISVERCIVAMLFLSCVQLLTAHVMCLQILEGEIPLVTWTWNLRQLSVRFV